MTNEKHEIISDSGWQKKTDQETGDTYFERNVVERHRAPEGTDCTITLPPGVTIKADDRMPEDCVTVFSKENPEAAVIIKNIGPPTGAESASSALRDATERLERLHAEICTPLQEPSEPKYLNDTDLFILSRKQIIDLVHECGGIEADGPDLINFIVNDKYTALPENSLAVLYKGSGGEIMIRRIGG